MANAIVTKYILTDEDKPLYALAQAGGQDFGPITVPTEVSMSVLRKLLLQVERPSRIYEVIRIGFTPDGREVFSDRVRLTLQNYDTTWYSISNHEEPTDGPTIYQTVIFEDGHVEYLPEDEDKFISYGYDGPMPGNYQEYGNVGDKAVDFTNRGNGRILIYNEATDKNIYVDLTVDENGSAVTYVKSINGSIGTDGVMELIIPTLISQLDNDTLFLKTVSVADEISVGGIIAEDKTPNEIIEVKIDSFSKKLYCQAPILPETYVTTVTVNGELTPGSVINLVVPTNITQLTNDLGFIENISPAGELQVGAICALVKSESDNVELKIDPTSHKLYVSVPQQSFVESGLIADKVVNTTDRNTGYVPTFNSTGDEHVYKKLPKALADFPNDTPLSTLEKATNTTFGVINATTKTENEDIPIKIDQATGFLYSIGKPVSGSTITIGTSTSGYSSSDCDYLCDGIDDQVEINNALSKLSGIGGTILILSGTYTVSAPILITENDIVIRGLSDSVIITSNVTIDPLISISGFSVHLSNMTLDGIANVSPNPGIRIDGAEHITIKSMKFINFINTYAISALVSMKFINIIDSFFYNNSYSIYLDVISSADIISDIYIFGNSFQNLKNRAIYIGNGCIDVCIGNNLISNDTYITPPAISIQRSTISYCLKDIMVSNNNISNFGYGFMVIGADSGDASDSKIIIINNTVSKCGKGILLSTIFNSSIINNSLIDNGSGIDFSTVNNSLVCSNLCMRGTGLSSDYLSTQYTMNLVATYDSLISSNICMGKNIVITGTGNDIYDNKYS